MKTIPLIFFLAAALLPLATAAPARVADTPHYMPLRGVTQQYGAAPTAEELTRLFYEKAPEHAGKPVVVEYGWAAERVWQGSRSVPTGKRFGSARVQERALHEYIRSHRGNIKGGGALRVIFDPETGRIIQALRAK